MGLYGSEYWTYSLPKRVGKEKAIEITETCMPMSTQVTQEIGLIDSCFGNDHLSFQIQIQLIAEEIAQSPDYRYKLNLKNQLRRLEEQFKPLVDFRIEELEHMKANFFDPNYHKLRYNFVHKIPPSETPMHLAKHRQPASLNQCQMLLPDKS